MAWRKQVLDLGFVLRVLGHATVPKSPPDPIALSSKARLCRFPAELKLLVSKSWLPTGPKLFLVPAKECFFLAEACFGARFSRAACLCGACGNVAALVPLLGHVCPTRLKLAEGLRIYGKGRTDTHSRIAYGLFL